MNRLNLLRDGRQHPLLQTIELVEATPRADLTQADEDAAHGLEVEGLVAVEDEDESAELVAQSFHGFGLSRSGGTERRTAEARGQGLSHRQVASVEIKFGFLFVKNQQKG